MQCQFSCLLCTILYLIPNSLCSGVIIDCFFIENITDSVELVCDPLKGSHPESGCFLQLFSLDAAFSNHRANVKLLKTGRCTSSNLRRRFFESFNNLRSIDVSYFGVDTISDLQLKYVQTFNASHNKLTVIRATNLRYMPDIREIDLSFNQISTLEYGSFSRLRELRILNLSSNSIEKLEHEPFKNNKKLENLLLQNNPMRRIDGNIFSMLKRSVSVSVSWESVREIDTTILGGALQIDIDHNFEITFHVSHRLVGLKCTGNVFQNLTYLNISGNHLENSSKIVELLGSSIEILDLNSNFIGKVCSVVMSGCSTKARIFQRTINLQILNLSETNLTHIDVEAFRSMKKLRSLDLSFNQLQTLDLGSVVLNDLHTLKVEGNRLEELNWVNQSNLPKLSFFNIAQNHLSCNNLDQFMKKWSNLHLLSDPSKQRNDVDCKRSTKHVANSTENITNTMTLEGNKDMGVVNGNREKGIGSEVSGITEVESTQRITTTEVARKKVKITGMTEITGTTVEMIRTINETYQRPNDETIQIIKTAKKTEASKDKIAENMETTTDINLSLDATNSGDFSFDEVQSSSGLTELTSDSLISTTESTLHNTLDTTEKILISNSVPRTDFTKSIIFDTKYMRKRRSPKFILSAHTIALALFAVVIISIGYLAVRLKCSRRFRRNLKGKSNHMNIPYKLDQSDDSRNHIELIDHIDFRQWHSTNEQIDIVESSIK